LQIAACRLQIRRPEEAEPSSAVFQSATRNPQFQRLEVRNFVAVQLVKALGLSAQPDGPDPEWTPDPDWTAPEWAELRAKVRAKVTAELQR
jgi:hypothetical protein